MQRLLTVDMITAIQFHVADRPHIHVHVFSAPKRNQTFALNGVLNFLPEELPCFLGQFIPNVSLAQLAPGYVYEADTDSGTIIVKVL